MLTQGICFISQTASCVVPNNQHKINSFNFPKHVTYCENWFHFRKLIELLVTFWGLYSKFLF